MSWTRRAVIVLSPMVLLLTLGLKSYDYPSRNLPVPTSSYVMSLLSWQPWQCLVAFAGLVGSLPLCVAISLRVRHRLDTEEIDTVGILLRQIGTIVAVQLLVFFGLIAIGRLTAGSFLAAEAGVFVLGRWALRRINPATGDPAEARQARRVALGIVAGLALCGLASVHFGQDVGYDFFNYHYYNAHAFVHQRGDFDFAVADWNTHFNPLLDVAYYLVAQSVRPVWAGFIVGAVHGVGVVLLYGIALELLGRVPALRGIQVPLAISCTLAGICEPMFLAEIGTTFHDVLLTAFILAALLLLLRLVGRSPRAPHVEAISIAALAGLLAGSAIGFKLTMATYGVGLALILLFAPNNWKERLGLTAMFGTAALLGFLVSNGYWMVSLYTRYGNPFFPFFNNFFKSPYWSENGITFQHMTIGFRWFDHLLAPFYLMKTSALLSEGPSRDSRLALAYVLVTLAGLRRLVAWSRTRFAAAPPLGRFAEPGAMLLIGFAVVSYLVWYKQFRVLRYLVALKMLIPLVCVLLLLELLRNRRRVWLASTVLLVLIAAQIEVPSFGRRAWKNTFLDYHGVKTVKTENAIVLMISSMEWPRLGQGIGAVATELPSEMRFIKIDSPQLGGYFSGSRLADHPLAMELRVREILDAHPGPVYLLSHLDPHEREYQNSVLARYKLAIAPGQTPKPIHGWFAELGYFPLTPRPDALADKVPRPRPEGEIKMR